MARRDLNSVSLVGRLVRDAEVRFTAGGMAICHFSIAVNYTVKRGDQWEEAVNYFDIVVFGKQGEALQPYLTRGQQVSVMGELRQNRWEKDGQTRSKVEIMANQVGLLGSASGGQRQQAQPNQRPAQQQSYSQPTDVSSQIDSMPGPEAFEEDIPF